METDAGERAEGARGHLDDTSHQGEEGVTAALHGVAKNEDQAQGNKEEGGFHRIDHSPGHEISDPGAA